MEKISQVLSSNTMRQYTQCCSRWYTKPMLSELDMMELYPALAVVRYNEGYGGIKRLWRLHSIEITHLLKNAFNLFDIVRGYQTAKIISEHSERGTGRSKPR